MSEYTEYLSTNCFTDNGAGSFQIAHTETGVQECQRLCNELPFGMGENHCSCIVVRSNGMCYLKDGIDSTGCDITQCPDEGSSKSVYIRGKHVHLNTKLNYIFFYDAMMM